MAVAEIGHLHEYAYRCQNASFHFPFEMRCFRIGDQIDVEMQKWPIFGHVLVTDAKMPHFKGKMKWGILASVCIFMQLTYLCHSHLEAFWQPSCISIRNLFQMLRWLRNRENGNKAKKVEMKNFETKFDYSHYHLLETRIDEDDIVQRMISYTPDYQHLVAAWANLSTQDSLIVWNTGTASIIY